MKGVFCVPRRELILSASLLSSCLSSALTATHRHERPKNVPADVDAPSPPVGIDAARVGIDITGITLSVGGPTRPFVRVRDAYHRHRTTAIPGQNANDGCRRHPQKRCDGAEAAPLLADRVVVVVAAACFPAICHAGHRAGFLEPPPHRYSGPPRPARLPQPPPPPPKRSLHISSPEDMNNPAVVSPTPGVLDSLPPPYNNTNRRRQPARLSLVETYAPQATDGRVQQSTEDFVRRTDRAMARETAAKAQYQQQYNQRRQQLQQQQRQQEQDAKTAATAGAKATVYPTLQQKPRRPSSESPVSVSSSSTSSSSSSTAGGWAARSRNSSFDVPMRSPSWGSQTSQSSQATRTTQRTSIGSMVAEGRPPKPAISYAQAQEQARAQARAQAQAQAQANPDVRVQNQWQRQWQRPALLKTQRKKAAPGEVFAALPGEVLELILDELKRIHLAEGSSSCATCWMRDACSMAVTARKMLKYARVALYEAVQLVGADAAQQRKKLKPLQYGTRLVLLRRTLRSNPQIAAIVRSLKVPTLPTACALPADYDSLIASVVMACPNLERVVGYSPAYSHTTFSRYFHALSTRSRLKEINWLIESVAPPHEQKAQQIRTHSRARSRSMSLSGNQRSIAQMMRPLSPPLSPKQQQQQQQPMPTPLSTELTSPLPLERQQSVNFLGHHVNWQYLTSMTVHCKPGATLSPDTLLVDAFMYLPALQNLYLSHLPRTAFDDNALVALPPLKKLALVHLPGITSDGLSRFATRGINRSSLVSLTLVHVQLDALQAVARMLSKLAALTTFSLVQKYPPTLTPGEVIWLFPYLASASLQHLHWDLPTYVDRANAADMVLARSIAAGGFPQLRRLRAPADPEGLFQALCRPLERVDLPGDRSKQFGSRGFDNNNNNPSHQHKHSRSSSSSSSSIIFPPSFGHAHSRNSSNASNLFSHKSSGSSPPPSADMTRPPLPQNPQQYAPPEHTHLHAARMAAQARLDKARGVPQFFVNVINEDGLLAEKYGMAGFVGTIQSQIAYHLVPDPGATDASGGLVDMDTFLADGGERLSSEGKESAFGSSDRAANRREDGCVGRWNANWDVPQKKDKERWWHTERGRWKARGHDATTQPPRAACSTKIMHPSATTVLGRRLLCAACAREARRTLAVSTRAGDSSRRTFPAPLRLVRSLSSAARTPTSAPARQSPSQPQLRAQPRSQQQQQQQQQQQASSGTPSPSTAAPAGRLPFYALFPKTLPQGPPPHGPFDINLRALRTEFLRLQAAAHPDFHHHASGAVDDEAAAAAAVAATTTTPTPTPTPAPADDNHRAPERRHSAARARAEALSAGINEAYKTLASPLLRAQYLLQQRFGIDLAGDEATTLWGAGDGQNDTELLMAVLDVREAIERAEAEDDLAPIRADNDERMRASEAALAQAFAADDPAAARREAVRLRYWVNIDDALRNWERGKDIVLEH
ncbi:Co-chaperone Hsc20 [Niveomyces insectorum RCEF 264]|uniref:Co-chaperone Hsc20 n=1 Tax=Niveomyces insectorum RCEF 264 TaxID=1081102 RepID=A0A167WYV8_9HYPO|nr:Co-chaperone Hsc20 [Niveomyces insectorum RCEF 264]